MKQVILRQGCAVVEQVPAPLVEPGTVLVRVDHSCISIGTEMSGLKTSGLPLWKRALKQPENVKKVVSMASSLGIKKTRSVIKGRLAAGSATGYSAAGIIIAVGDGVRDLQVGDRVACAGAQCAHHAELIRVPRNLTVRVPDALSLSHAATVTLGAISLQGVRRGNPTLGETFVVIGLGILGQLTCQLLKANGCRVIGTDIDRKRLQLGRSLGLDVALHPDDAPAIDQVARLTDGLGADGVIITAATPSDSVVSTAFAMCRKKGRVVLVGDVGLHLNRADFYQKEIDFYISTSYGPGRYDDNYEEKGLDYPVAYVRWTENRNMAEFLRLLAEQRVRLEPLIAATYPLEKAGEAYVAIDGGAEKPLMVLLQYPQPEVNEEVVRVVGNPAALPAGKGRIRLALVGAGGFAKGMHLPNIQALSDMYHLQAVVSRTGHNAVATAKQFGANYSSTDYEKVLADPEIDAVLIATRHNLHARMALAALKAGKHVLVEKPLALTAAELEGIEAFYAGKDSTVGLPVLMTGFNRRFSVFARRIREMVRERTNPMILNYRMNAGHIPRDHWVHGEEGGGRNIGEACHIYDLFTFLTGSRMVSVVALPLNPSTGYYGADDNFVATMQFADGSVATLTYTALGSKEYPKEQLEVYVDGMVMVLNDYMNLDFFGSKAKGIHSKIIDKGQKDELQAFAATISAGGAWPIALWEQFQAMEIAFRVEQFLVDGGGKCAE